jgi:hypothetical protein
MAHGKSPEINAVERRTRTPAPGRALAIFVRAFGVSGSAGWLTATGEMIAETSATDRSKTPVGQLLALPPA